MIVNNTSATNIISIDFSHFDSSSLVSTESMFSGISLLEEINFNNFDASKISNMGYMFYYCENLKSLDLLNFVTPKLEKISSMFSGCKSLEYLDISNFDTSKVNQKDSLFYNISPLKYINLYNAQIDNIKDAILGIIQDNIIICQKNDFEIGIQITYNKACYDYNLETSSCDPNNYIKLKYKKEITYPYGFKIIEYDKSENQYRPDIYLINNNNKRYKPNETLIIKENKEIKIYLNTTYISLAKFFYAYYDPNVEYISSIDLTHFDSSLVESLESTFYG